MPEDYMMHRYRHEDDGSVDQWWAQWNDLSEQERNEVLPVVLNNDFRSLPFQCLSRAAVQFLEHYTERDMHQLALFD